ncbi:MAG: Tex family protein [Bacteroidales bacterium]|nr:RNA-binding transcriptional accessory protein [Bacteroidales bacterium]
MSDHFIKRIAAELQLPANGVRNTLQLLSEDATIPFISRYRKERTGGLDEVQIGAISDLNDKLTELDKRKNAILSSIEEQEKLTPELKKRIEDCWQMNELEDLYLPYKPKRHTRAEVARQKGLEPLAKLLMAQNAQDVESSALPFVKDLVESVEDALKGARDIIAEWVNENERSRQMVRNRFRKEAVITSKVFKGKEEQAVKYKDYFDYSEPLKRCTSHRYLAVTRGESEGFLKVSITPDDDNCCEDLYHIFLQGTGPSSRQVKDAVCDGFKRLLKPSIETEFAALSKEKSDDEAIRIFADNLKQLLLAAPLGQRRVLGIDPGFRTGCKIVCLDAQGKLLHNETIYPHAPQHETGPAARKITHLVETYDIQAIAIGNGTASRETEEFIQNLRYDRKIQVFVVSENGASIYSASKIAREEFPDYDVTVRGSVSIGRRLMDPLAELVKIEPKSIGVGQYQHDVDQGKLKKSLDQTVINCVNQVGVNLNTASKYLLTYVSGLNSVMAQNIVEYRNDNGAFESRSELMKVPRIGPKAFEQAAGFLRIPDAKNPLDNTAVHPEQYALVEKMAKDLKCSVKELIEQKELRKNIRLENYISEEVGMLTLKDILEELDKPGRDPRSKIEVFEFDKTIHKIEDLREGMVLPGIVTNITAFGCFVDVGVKENGLVHLSQMADRYITDPSQVVSLHQHLKVKILNVDLDRKRIQLSMKGL